MSAIRLADAAKHDAGLPHQLAAWNALQETLTPKQLEDFAELYRAAPAVKVSVFQPSSPFSHKLTPNVTYGEFTQQSEARRFTAQHQCDTALVLAQFVQKARDHFGGPAIITSGHRPPKINAQVGGASRSEHLYNAPNTGAVDFYIDGVSVYTLQDWADKALAVFPGLRGCQGLHPRRDALRQTSDKVGLLTPDP
jgi:hypothetical protein